jgi:transcriptional regulator with XRE-family HTH domain
MGEPSYTRGVIKNNAPQEGAAFNLAVGERLKHLREDVRKLSPEDVEERAAGAVSASYIRRVEKGESSPTVDKLDTILRALDSSLGLFFEYQIDASTDANSQDRRFQRALQRGLESDIRKDVAGAMRLIERALGGPHAT